MCDVASLLVKFGRQLVAEMDSVLEEFIPDITFKLHKPSHWKTLVAKVRVCILTCLISGIGGYSS